jgi:glc operon protein GlcG
VSTNLVRIGLRRFFVCAASGILFAAVAATAFAQAPQSGSVVITGPMANRALSKADVSLDAAMRMVNACEQFATQNNFVVVGYVLDPFGSIVYVDRMDGIRPIESEEALARAKAALFNRGASGGGGGNPAAAANANAIPGQIRVQQRGGEQRPGGLAIIVDNEFVGAIGIAGSDTMDEACARAGLAAVGIVQPNAAPVQAQPVSAEDRPGTPAQGNVPLTLAGAAAKRAATKTEISGAAAFRIAEGCRAWGKQHNDASIMYILDPSGNIVHAYREDGTRPVQFDSASDKAKTALLTRMTTIDLNNKVGADVPTLVRYRLRGLDLGPGGIPIIVDDQLIGTIGVAGQDPLDEPCAIAGLASVGITQKPSANGPPLPTQQSQTQPPR